MDVRVWSFNDIGRCAQSRGRRRGALASPSFVHHINPSCLTTTNSIHRSILFRVVRLVVSYASVLNSFNHEALRTTIRVPEVQNASRRVPLASTIRQSIHQTTRTTTV